MVHIAAFYTCIAEIFGEILSHFFGERSYQCALVFLNAEVYFAYQIIYLPLDGTDGYLRIQKSGRSYYLLGDLPRPLALKVSGSSGNIHRLIYSLLKFLKLQGSVIIRRGQTESVLNKRILAGAVAAVHCSHLRQGNVALIHEQQEILREIVEQRHRSAANGTAGYYSGIVFDTRAIAELLHHLDIVIRALGYALRFKQLAVFLKILDSLIALCSDIGDRPRHFFLADNIMAGGIYGSVVQIAQHGTGHDVYLAYSVDLIAEEFHPYGLVIRIRRKNLDSIAANAEHISLKGDIIALIAYLNELAQKLVKAAYLPGSERYHHTLIVDGVTETVDAGHRGDHYYVCALKKA